MFRIVPTRHQIFHVLKHGSYMKKMFMKTNVILYHSLENNISSAIGRIDYKHMTSKSLLEKYW